MEEQLKPSGIGGQAVMEGVMMRNRSKYAVAVKQSDGRMVLNVKEYHSISEKIPFLGWPFLRGAVNLIESMIVGMGTLMYSANFVDEEPAKDGEKAAKKAAKEAAREAAREAAKEAAREAATEAVEPSAEAVPASEEEKSQTFMTPAMVGLTVVLSLAVTIALFMLLPFAITSLFERVTGIESAWVSSILEGLIRIGIFIGYVALIARMEEIKRVFRYHGAEHKTINCIEHGLPLTVENARVSSKEHKRCGTSFMIFVMVISILVFSIVNLFPLYTGYSRVLKFLVRFGVRLLLLPVVAGLSYEFLRLAGRTNNRVIAVLSKPGLWMQALTTKEPDDEMLAVAIASVEAVFDWKAFLAGTAADQCAVPLEVGEYLIADDGSYVPTVTGFLNAEK